jgi:hypothetical protein
MTDDKVPQIERVNMTKKEARSLLNARGATRLGPTAIAILKELIHSTYLRDKGGPLESGCADVPLTGLAFKIGVQDRAIQRNIAQLVELRLLTVHLNTGRNRQNTYTVTLTPMWDWPTTKKEYARHRETQNEARSVLQRVRREVQKAMPPLDATDELVAYAQIERSDDDERT